MPCREHLTAPEEVWKPVRASLGSTVGSLTGFAFPAQIPVAALTLSAPQGRALRIALAKVYLCGYKGLLTCRA